jgi:hypothetical protein
MPPLVGLVGPPPLPWPENINNQTCRNVYIFIEKVAVNHNTL